MIANQRSRLFGALAHALAARGYGATSVSEVIRLAGVSRATFYQHFRDKEDCFLAAYDDIAARTERVVLEAYRKPGPQRERLRDAVRAFIAFAQAEPDAMSLMLLYALGAGPRALSRRNQTLDELERRIRVSRDRQSAVQQADLTVMVILGGIREVVSARLRSGDLGDLEKLTDELSTWALCYPVSPPGALSMAHSERESRVAQASGGERVTQRLPSGRHDLPRQFIANNQRERIVDAVATIIAQQGYSALTIPTICKQANVSHQTFYEFYETKHDAFLGAQKVGLHQALLVAVNAYQMQAADWPRAIGAGLRALAQYLASEPAHAHLSLLDTLAAGPQSLEIREAGLRSFATYLEPGYAHAGDSDDRSTVPPVAAHAIAGGIWQILLNHVATRKVAELPEVAGQLTYVALTPFLGAERAAQIACEF